MIELGIRPETEAHVRQMFDTKAGDGDDELANQAQIEMELGKQKGRLETDNEHMCRNCQEETL